MTVGVEQFHVVRRLQTASAAPYPMVDLAVFLRYPQGLAADRGAPRLAQGLRRRREQPRLGYVNGGKYWRNFTGNLKVFTPSLKLAGGASSLRTTAILSPRSGLGGNTVIVGGFGGIYALCNPGASGPRASWVKLGDGAPNAVVRDVHYDAKDDIVIAGTFGRGAWILSHPHHFLRPTDRRTAMASRARSTTRT